MRIEFLGHGLHENNINTVGDWLCSTLKDEDYFSFIGFSAFTKMSGINRIKTELLIAKARFSQLKFILGIVENGTSKEALQFMIDHEIETYVYTTSKSIMFHPKMYYFKGKHNSRFIMGSSNLTSAGLFDNIEASTLFEFSKIDAVGNKFVRQYEQYFQNILNGEDNNIQRLDENILIELEKLGFIKGEKDSHAEIQFLKKNKKFNSTGWKRKFNKEEIGNQTSKPISKTTNSNKEYPEITSLYLDSWPEYFELFKAFKRENVDMGEKYSVTVPRDYKNPSLYNWYRLQKVYYKHEILPLKHETLLIQEKFYFKDAHLLWQEYKEETKLLLLTEALLEDEDIRVNHRYIYKGEHLGTWLVGVAQAIRKGKKLELNQKILDLGFDISATSRNHIDSAKRFVTHLLEAENPDKGNFQRRFNGTIRDRIDKIPKDIQQDIVEAWYLQFNEFRPLGKIREHQHDRTEEWKKFRYNKTINPEGKWLASESKMGDVFWWARQKRENKSRMDLIKHHFTKKEKEELRSENYLI